MSGVLDKNNLAEPIVWLSERALHDVLLQGTGVLNVEGSLRYFNVHRNNGISYDYTKGKTEQVRYWYFSEVPGVMGYGKEQNTKVLLQPNISFAGNVTQLGLGKLLLVSYDTSDRSIKSRLGILADEGGAFDNNLFQLDLLVGNYQGWTDYYQANKYMDDYAAAWLLLKK